MIFSPTFVRLDVQIMIEDTQSMERLSTDSTQNKGVAPPKWRLFPFLFPLLAFLLAGAFFRPAPATTNSEESAFYFPLLRISRPVAASIEHVWTEDDTGNVRQAFSPGETVSYKILGLTHRSTPISATLSITRSSSCEEPLVYSTTLTLPAGYWAHTTPAFPAGACHGSYSASTLLEAVELTATMATTHVVNLPTTLVLSENQGFDRCRPPTVEEMQTWWDTSPYTVFNLYLGGISFFCDDTPLDPVWVHSVAQQGWRFILAWVGPQAPCTGFNHRMSEDPAQAYEEGREQAAAAAAAAWNLGLFGDRLISIDIEAFPGSNEDCRDAVQSYLQGWVEELHALGLQAGGYGSPCGSYQFDWADNNPAPDQVWIAHWLRDEYDPDVTVWGTPCLPDSLWPDHQRIKQYAGGHIERWGNVSLTIDSNVLDGAVTELTGTTSIEPIPTTLVQHSRDLASFGILGSGSGWALSEGTLFVTGDNGLNWAVLRPPNLFTLGANFTDNGQIFVVGRHSATGDILFSQSGDGGGTWTSKKIAEAMLLDAPPVRAWIRTPDRLSFEIAIQLTSGNSFSRWRGFVSTDGGETWVQGEIYDGTPNDSDSPPFWAESISTKPDPNLHFPEGAVEAQFLDETHGWVMVREGVCEGEKTAEGLICEQRTTLMSTADGGVTWNEIRALP